MWPPETLTQLLENTPLTDHFSMMTFFEQLASLLGDHRVVLFIDEFDGIPQAIVSDFLYALRYIYLSEEFHCPHSVGIVGVKNIRQRNYDDSISPFNIQDEFIVPNFTLEQVHELLEQYMAEVGQPLRTRHHQGTAQTDCRGNPSLSIGVRKFSPRNWTSLKLKRLRWTTSQRHTCNSLRKEHQH